MQDYAKEQGLNIEVFKLDVNNPLDCAQVDKYDIDVFVANAAIGQGGPLAELPVENLRQIFEKNVFRSLELVQLVAKQMVAKKKWYDEKTNFTKRADLLKGEKMLAQQFDPQDMIEKMVEIIDAKHHPFRNVYPEASEQQVKEYQAKLWEGKV